MISKSWIWTLTQEDPSACVEYLEVRQRLRQPREPPAPLLGWLQGAELRVDLLVAVPSPAGADDAGLAAVRQVDAAPAGHQVPRCGRDRDCQNGARGLSLSWPTPNDIVNGFCFFFHFLPLAHTRRKNAANMTLC